MAKEIERKFLLATGSIPIPEEHSIYKIKQGYILTEKHRQVRVRISKDKAVLGIKFTGDMVRDEYEYEIPMKDGEEIYGRCTGTIEKERLTFESGDERFDVDRFPHGVTFVEVEFKSLDHLFNWDKPKWIGKEITNVKKYSNIIIAKENLKF